MIKHINDLVINNYNYFFLDANVWIYQLRGSSNLENWLEPYIKVFDSIINKNDTLADLPAKVKKDEVRPRIILTSMLLSEIINSYLRNVAMKRFCPNCTDFKKEYREDKYSNYDSELKSIITDITSFSDYIYLLDDSFNNIDIFTKLELLDRSTDFNDLYYNCLLENKDIPIITNDADFNVEYNTIYTANNKLLNINS